jgi:hypothetical protein
VKVGLFSQVLLTQAECFSTGANRFTQDPAMLRDDRHAYNAWQWAKDVTTGYTLYFGLAFGSEFWLKADLLRDHHEGNGKVRTGGTRVNWCDKRQPWKPN